MGSEVNLSEVCDSFSFFLFFFIFITNKNISFYSLSIFQETNVENVALLVIKYFKALPRSLLYPFDTEFTACQKSAGTDPLELIRTLPGFYLDSFIFLSFFFSFLFFFF